MAIARTILNQTGTGNTVDGATTDMVTVAIPTDTVVFMLFSCVRKAADGDGRGSVLSAAFRNVAGTVTQIESTDSISSLSDADLATATVACVISGTDVILRGTGVVGQTIDWLTNVTTWVD